MIQRRIAHFAAVIVLISALGTPFANAGTIPAAAIDQPKLLWRMVMESYYGPYDNALKCWIGKFGADRVCARPHRLDNVEINGVDHLYLVAGGPLLDDQGGTRESHADVGALGLIVLRKNGKNLKFVAKNDLHTPFGSFGLLPAEDQFAIREIGPNDTYGWVAKSGWMGQGHIIASSTIFAPIGDTVLAIGDIPDHYDNTGNCENGKIIGSETPCTDYSATVIFDSTEKSGRFYPIIVKVQGTREGVSVDETFNAKFDVKKLSYGKIHGMPKEFDEGI